MKILLDRREIADLFDLKKWWHRGDTGLRGCWSYVPASCRREEESTWPDRDGSVFLSAQHTPGSPARIHERGAFLAAIPDRVEVRGGWWSAADIDCQEYTLLVEAGKAPTWCRHSYKTPFDGASDVDPETIPQPLRDAMRAAAALLAEESRS